MMEDWTDIIGSELENIEVPPPADDWNVFQQKYAIARRRRKAAVFAWAGGVAAVVAAGVIFLFPELPDSTPVNNDMVAESMIPESEQTQESILVLETEPSPEVESLPESLPIAQPKPILDPVADALPESIPEQEPESIPEQESIPQTFDVITKENYQNENLIADASLGFDDFAEEIKQLRRRVSIGLSRSVAGISGIGIFDGGNNDALIVGPGDNAPSTPPGNYDEILPTDPPLDSETPPGTDSTYVSIPKSTHSIIKRKKECQDTYSHDIPISIGLSVRFHLADRFTITTGLNYTRYSSTRMRQYDSGEQVSDKQYAHYLGIPVRVDWIMVNRKHFNFYMGAGAQMDKCIYAVCGNERLTERQFLCSVNAALGLQVNIVPKVGLYIEPDLSYTLNDGTLETFRSDKPFMFTARAGLRFNF